MWYVVCLVCFYDGIKILRNICVRNVCAVCGSKFIEVNHVFDVMNDDIYSTYLYRRTASQFDTAQLTKIKIHIVFPIHDAHNGRMADNGGIATNEFHVELHLFPLTHFTIPLRFE